MRGADGGPGRRICALPAFWVGLLYDSAALDAAWDIVKDWTAEERQALREAVPRLGLKAPFRDGTVLDLAREVVGLARGGLARRGYLNESGRDETMFLTSLEEIVATGATPAEHLLDEFESEWNGDINEVFRRYAY
jgi:glutamate--cysteine ligase